METTTVKGNHNNFFDWLLRIFSKSRNSKGADISKYKTLIANLANIKDDYIFPNSSQQHATVVMCNIFRTAEEYVYIVAQDLAGHVSNADYVKALKDFLEKDDVELRVILDQRPVFRSEAINMILEQKNHSQNTKIEIGYVENTDSIRRFFGGQRIHFTIADERMFRKEIDTDKFIAIGSFNRTDYVKELKEIFNDIPNVIPIDNNFPFIQNDPPTKDAPEQLTDNTPVFTY